MGLGRAILGFAAATLAATTGATGALADPAQWRASPWHDPVTLYRIERPRSPVPSAPEGVRTMTDTGIAAAGARILLIDVSPAPMGKRDPASGRWTIAGRVDSIPGALWFPEAGRVPGEAAVIAEFIDAVPKLAAGRPVVVFCLADCWMSWNAALRLHRMGLDVGWYAAGRDGWAAAGRRMQAVQPFANGPFADGRRAAEP